MLESPTSDPEKQMYGQDKKYTGDSTETPVYETYTADENIGEVEEYGEVKELR